MSHESSSTYYGLRNGGGKQFRTEAMDKDPLTFPACGHEFDPFRPNSPPIVLVPGIVAPIPKNSMRYLTRAFAGALLLAGIVATGPKALAQG